MKQNPSVLTKIQTQDMLMALALKTSQAKMSDSRWKSIWDDRETREIQ